MRAGLLALLLSVAVITPALAQEIKPIDVDQVLVDDYPIVSVVVTAPPEMVGLNLDESSVAVFENDERRDVAITKLPNDELEVLLLLDTSGSMSQSWAATQEAALGFVARMPATTRMAVLGFGSSPVVATEFTANFDAVADGIESLRPRGETALYDALLVALDQFEPGPNVRRTLVLLSDGGDTVSVTSGVDAVQALAGSEINFYAIELESFENDSAAIAELAEAAEGAVVPAADTAALADIYDRIAKDLVNQYRISYVSEAFDSTLLQIAIDAGGLLGIVEERVSLPAAPAPLIDRPEPAADVPLLDAVEPRSGAVVGLGWLDSDVAGIAGIALLSLALAISLVYVLYPRPKAVALSNREILQERAGRRVPQSTTVIQSMAQVLTGLAERIVQTGGKRDSLSQLLEGAGILLRPGEFLVFTGSMVTTAFAVGATVVGPAVGLAAAVLVLVGVIAYVKRRRLRRRRAFADQLDETLQLMAGTLRAGYGLLQAIDTVAQEGSAPTGDEFRRLVQEVRLGRELIDALESLSGRVQNEDFVWVMSAIAIQREVGGDLAEVLDNVASTIRARTHLRRQVDALAADGKLSAAILIPLPFFVAGVIAIITPSYISELFTTAPGRILVVISIVFMVVGSWWMSKIVKVEF